MNRSRLLYLYFSIVASTCSAQTPGRETVTQFTNWFSTSSTMTLSKRFNLFVDGQYRFVQGFEPMVLQFRVGGEFKISNSALFMPVGYAYTEMFQYGKQPIPVANKEHRIFQQFTIKHKVAAWVIQHRIRTEERFIQKHHLDTNGEYVDDGFQNQQFRFRYRFYTTIPISKQQDTTLKSIAPRSWYLVVYDEMFLSWGESVTYHGIDQNRVFAGLGYQFTNDFTIQSGFFYQLFIKAGGTQQENNMGVGTWLTYNLDFTKS